MPARSDGGAGARPARKRAAAKGAGTGEAPEKKPARKRAEPSLADLMLEDLARSGLDASDARAMRLKPGDPEELARLGLPDKKSYEIPYLGLDGRPTGFRRWRYLEDTRSGPARMTDKKPIRYVQQGDTLPGIYLPPQCDWKSVAQDASVTVVFTEGEKKASAMCKAGVPTVGLGGVYSFKSNKRKVPLLQEFYEFAWKDRDVVVAYDSDAHCNHLVVAARNELCRELLVLGAVPRVADLPDAEGGKKQGLDDMLVAEGLEAVEQALSWATSYAASAALHELSAEVAYVRDPGIVVRMDNGMKMTAMAFTGHAYSNRHYHEVQTDKDGKEKMVKRSAAKAWLEWEQRYELACMSYEPGKPRVTEDSTYNTWPGWGVQPKKGPIGPWNALLDRVFGADRKARQWFERWLALPLQRPGSKMFTSVLLWGVEEGTGKSLAGKTMGRIYGKNYTLIGDGELADSRNEWAQNKQFVLGDDVTGHENRKYAERLKVIITQEMIRIDPKYIPSYTVRDVINYLFTSNRPDAFFLDDNNRRNFVWEVGPQVMTQEQVAEYFEWLDEKDGAAHLFHHLLELDLGGMEASDRAPWTVAKDAMIEDSQSSLGRWIRDLKSAPDAVLRVGEAVLKGDLWSGQDLLRLYDPDDKKSVSAAAISREMKRAGFKLVYKGCPVPTKSGQRRLFAVRDAKRWLDDASVREMSHHYDETRGPAKGKKF